MKPGTIVNNCLSTTEQVARFRLLLDHLGQQFSRKEKILSTLDAARETLDVPVVLWFESGHRERCLASPDILDNPAEVQACLDTFFELHPAKVTTFSTRETGLPALADIPVHSIAAAPLRSKDNKAWVLAVNSNPHRVLGHAELQLLDLTVTLLNKQLVQDSQLQTVRGSLIDIVRCLASVIDAKDACTAGHSDRVSQIASRIGRAMGLPGRDVNALRLSGLMHDIGKIGIRDGVLTKPGKLTPEEFAHIQEHPIIGDGIVATISSFANLRSGVRSHHERMDGKGYPDGLRGDDIPLMARIMAVADSVDAMMSARCYRIAKPPPQIDQILTKFSNTQWDRRVVEAFMSCRKDIYPPIYSRGISESDTTMHAILDIVSHLADNSSVHAKLTEG